MIDPRTRRSDARWDQAECERQDASLTTGPTRQPFGRTSVYGTRVKTYLVKSCVWLLVSAACLKTDTTAKRNLGLAEVYNKHSVHCQLFLRRCCVKKTKIQPTEEAQRQVGGLPSR